MLLENYRSLLDQGWQPVFAQPRSHTSAPSSMRWCGPRCWVSAPLQAR
jgi:hypothetical protein